VLVLCCAVLYCAVLSGRECSNRYSHWSRLYVEL